MERTVIWLNGTFGVGKTSTAQELEKVLDESRTFDPEYVGFMLRRLIAEPVDDFQDWPAWRALVVETAVQLLDHYGGRLIAPMTLLRQDYAEQIFTSLAERGVTVRHVLLHADDDELWRRIESDQVERGARDWRIEHIGPYWEALPWLNDTATVIDTTALDPEAVAQKVAALL